MKLTLSQALTVAKTVLRSRCGGSPPPVAIVAGASLIRQCATESEARALLDPIVREALEHAKLICGNPVDGNALAALIEEIGWTQDAGAVVIDNGSDEAAAALEGVRSLKSEVDTMATEWRRAISEIAPMLDHLRGEVASMVEAGRAPGKGAGKGQGKTTAKGAVDPSSDPA